MVPQSHREEGFVFDEAYEGDSPWSKVGDLGVWEGRIAWEVVGGGCGAAMETPTLVRRLHRFL